MSDPAGGTVSIDSDGGVLCVLCVCLSVTFVSLFLINIERLRREPQMQERDLDA